MPLNQAKDGLVNFVSSLQDRLQVFSSEMTKPTFRNLIHVLFGWLFSSRHTVAAAIQASGHAGSRHHSAFYRIFSNAVWDVQQVGWNLAREIIQRFYPSPRTPVELVIDDTNATKSGRKIYGTGWHYDPLADSPGQTGKTWAHNWVVLAIMTQPLLSQAKRVALTVQARLYLPPKTAKKEELPYHTKLDLAAEMLRNLCDLYPKRTFRLLVDAAYGVGEMITRLPSNCCLVSRLRKDTRLFQPVALQASGVKRGRGRPRIRGSEMGKASEIFTSRKRKSVRKLMLYGKETQVEFVSFHACLYQVPMRVLRVVVVQFPESKGKQRSLVTLYSSDPSMRPEEIITAYCRRWSIEETFHDAKGHLGMDQPQSSSRKAVERMVPMILYMHSILWIWAGVEQLDRETATSKAPWNRSTQNLSMGDIIAIAREKQLDEIIKSTRVENSTLQKITRPLAVLIRAA